MSHLATEKQMISDVHLCSLMFTVRAHWTSTAARTELSGLSRAHQRVSTLQRLKPELETWKHDLQSNISKVLRFFAHFIYFISGN